jgi:putative proteasome-type protease
MRVTRFVQIDHANQYMQMIRNTWGARLKQVFQEIPDPTWRDANVAPGAPRLETELSHPVRAPLPESVEVDVHQNDAHVQLVAAGAALRPPR